MTPAEWIIALVITYWVVRGGLADLVAAARGGTPARVAEGRARARGGRYGAGGYIRDLWGDAWRVARARREARVARRLEHIRTHGPGPSWRERAGAAWARGWDRWERRMAARWDIRQRTAGRPQPEPVAPASEPAGGPNRPHHTRDHDQDPHVNQDQDQAGQRREPADPVEPVTVSPYDPDQQKPQELATYRGPDGRWHVVDPDAGATEPNPKGRDDHMAEVTGLASALAHATEMRRAFEESAAGAEQYLASLENGGVTGEALAAVQQAMEAQTQAATAWGQAEATLSRHMQVKEAYEANRDAGTREFVTAE